MIRLYFLKNIFKSDLDKFFSPLARVIIHEFVFDRALLLQLDYMLIVAQFMKHLLRLGPHIYWNVCPSRAQQTGAIFV